MKNEEILELVKELVNLDMKCDPVNDYIDHPENKPPRMVEVESILQMERIMDKEGCFICLKPEHEDLMDEIDKIVG